MFPHGQSQMYAAARSTCRCGGAATTFNCNSCQQWQDRQAKPFSSYQVNADCTKVAPPRFSVGLTPDSVGLVEGGAFNRHYYTKLDAYYSKYGKYCTRLAAMGAAKRHLANAAKALKQNDAANAVEEAEKAAIAMDADESESGQSVADSVDKVAENMSKAINGLIDRTKQNNKKAKVAAKKVEQGLENLESGDLAAAGDKMLEAAKQLNKIANSNKDDDGLQAAENVKQLGNTLKEAAKNLSANKIDVANERANTANAEKEVARQVEPQVKRALEANAQQAVEQAVEEVVNGQVASSAAAGNARAANALAAHANAAVNNAPQNTTVSNAARSLANAGAAGPIAPPQQPPQQQQQPQQNNGAAQPPIHPEDLPTLPDVRAKHMANTTCLFGCSGGPPRFHARNPERHAAAVRGIYDMYGNTSCNPCEPRAYRQPPAELAPQPPQPAPPAVDENPLSNWIHAQPKEHFASVIAEFGQPDWIVNQAGGQAVWLNKGIFSRVVLEDAAVPHFDHFDYLTFEVSGIDLPLEGIDELARLSESVWYDALTDTLYARCHFSGANVASLIVAIDLAHDDDMTLEEAQEAYPQLVEQSKDPQQYVEMLRLLEQDVQAARAHKQQKLAAAAAANANIASTNQ